MPGADVLESIEKLGPLLSGLGVLVGAGIAGISYLNFSRRTLYANWIERYGNAHAKFWNDGEIAEVRSWIEYRGQYDEISKIILKLLASEDVDLTDDERGKLEKLDRFCALISRMYLLEEDATTPKQQRLWRDIGGVYFIEKMQTPDRMALKRYVETYWQDLNKKISYNLFVYGTLTNPSTLREFLGGRREAKRGRLHGYEVCQGKWPYIVPKVDASAPGQILSGLTAADFEKLDEYEEAFPALRDGKMCRLYLRKLRQVQTAGKFEQCWVYLPHLDDWLPEWRSRQP